MSRKIFSDVEEALSRQVRRILYNDQRTLSKTVLKEIYDPLTGDILQQPIEPEFYDSSADAGGVQYPHFFIKLLRTREDRFTKRVVPQYGNWLKEPIKTAPQAYQVILPGSSVTIPTIGSTLNISTYQIRKASIGNLIRLTEGNNKGTYTISNIVINSNGNHIITVSNNICTNLPKIYFNNTTRLIQFIDNIDLHTVKVGDNFIDNSSNSYPITTVNADLGQIIIGGSTTPNLSQGSSIQRAGNVFVSTDVLPVRFMIMDATKPVEVAVVNGSELATETTVGVSPPVPIDAYYLVRIDSKARQNHIDILNRVWEEFNPPRTALPTVVRGKNSYEQLLTADIPSGGSTTVQVVDASQFKVGDIVFIFDERHPVMETSGKAMERPFEAKVIDIPSTTQVTLDTTVPDTFTVQGGAIIVSNAEYNNFMFHFVDHSTKDVEGSQYWVHEFVFWVQVWVDRYGDPALNTESAVLDTGVSLEDMNGHIIIKDD